MQKTLVGATVCGALLACRTAAWAGMDALRVYAVQPDCFEYKLTSVVSGAGDEALLSFNDLSGRTFFVRVGDKLGEYTLRSFEPATEREFVPTTHSFRDRKAGTAVLEDGQGGQAALKLGEVLSRPGWMACIVALDSGAWGHARDGDTVVLDGREMAVRVRSETSVAVASDGVEHPVAAIAEEEKDRLAALWEERRQAALARTERPPDSEEEDSDWGAPLVPARRVQAGRRHLPAGASWSVFGTEYRYPSEYEVRLITVRTPEGKIVVRPVAIPTRFQSRVVGIQYHTR